MLKRVSTVLIAAAAIAGCSDITPPSDSNVVPGGPQALVAQLSCNVDVAAGSLACAPASPTLPGGASADLIIGGQNDYVTLASTNVSSNGTTLTADVTVKNLTVQPWATTDGTTATPQGVRVFFHTLPSNGVTVASPSGTATYTATSQPYYQYDTQLGGDGILASSETSSAKTWSFTLNGATTFTFQVYVAAALPDEAGLLHWTQATPNQTGTEYVNAVWGTSSSDVWIGGTEGANTLQHWNGTSWTSYADTLPTLSLWGTSSTNVYAVGGPKVQRWNGTAWSELTSGTTNGLLAVWGSSTTDIYAGGLNGTLVHSSDGTTFSSVASTGIGGTEPVAAIWGSSSSDVWVGATSVYHWSGTAWSTVNTGVSNVRAIWGSSATDVWVGTTVGNMAHLQGGTWSTTTVGSSDIGGIWGTASNDVYMVNRAGEIWHYNGSSWVKYSIASTLFTGVWGSGRTDVWAVGGNGVPDQNRVYHGTR